MEDGSVQIVAPRPDCGQGTRTSLSMMVAEELDADWSRVQVVQADADEALYGQQGVGGSGSVRGSFMPLRRAGAAAKMMLVAAVAASWGVEASACTVRDGVITHASGRKATFAEAAKLAAASAAVPSDDQIRLKDPSEFRIIGKPMPRVDNANVVRGAAQFGLDVRVSGMKRAVIVRPPAFGATLESYDEKAALAVPGVTRVLPIGSGVAVVGASTWAVLQGAERLKARFSPGPNAAVNTRTITSAMIAELEAPPAPPANAVASIDAEYEMPYLAHATMEPMNATAHFKGDSCEIWAPTQQPGGCRNAVASALGLSQDKVRVHVTLLGGGFGRRLSQEYAVEAAQISKAMGEPVQLIWTREDDMKHDNYRPASYHRLRGAVDAQGRPVMWHHQFIQAGGGRRGGRNTGNAGIPYDLPNATMVRAAAAAPIPTGAWRSVDNTHLGFVNESFFDELARLAKKDPLEYRLDLLTNSRLRRCLQVVAEKSGWGGAELGKGRGRGVAVFSGYGSFIAQVAEVRVEANDEIHVERVVSAVDCGLAVNPLSVQAQVEGGTMDAVATTLFAAITIANGGVVESNFADFGWARMADAPRMEVHIVPSSAQVGGMGEVGYPAAQAAIANAVLAATGKRLRKLPARLHGLS
jgi:isoquinoline 1-oxidoreductase beta subunit